MRPDLLALAFDDLVALANKGKVNEAKKDLESNGVTGVITTADDGALHAEWSDGVKTDLPAKAALRAARCSCHSMTVCKHVIRLVLLLQKQAASAPPEANVAPVMATEPWCPGAITDDDLSKHFRTQVLTQARKLFDAGILAELVRSTRPTGRFHVPAVTVRFLAPGDPRYVRCDCAKPPPCEHVPLAVWAFRKLPADQRAGIVTAGQTAPPAAPELLDAVEETVASLTEHGLSGAGKGWRDRLTRLEQRLEDADLIWPAEVLAELIREYDSYANHDSRFAPERLAGLLGELIIRLDAIRNDTGELPQALIRGSAADRPMELSKGLFRGLGCEIHVERQSLELAAYLYDCKSGGVLVMSKDIKEEDAEDQNRSFGELGQRVALRGVSYAALGGGVLQLESGKRTARYELTAGRSKATVAEQGTLLWEEDISPPVLVEELEELECRLRTLPPSALRPRRLAEDFHVLRVAGVEQARFEPTSHTVQAVLLDGRGRRALLVHPYFSRGKEGAEGLLARLTSAPADLLFVSGRVSRTAMGVMIRPTGLVWRNGPGRVFMQPWVERQAVAIPAEHAGDAFPQAEEPAREHLHRLEHELGELLVLGLARAGTEAARAWRDLVTQGEAMGLTRLPGRALSLAEALAQKAHELRWEAKGATAAMLELGALLRLARDVG